MPERNIIIESFDNAADWSAIGAASSILDETSNFQQGLGAIKFNKGSSIDLAGIFKTYGTLDLGEFNEYRMDIYLPANFKDDVYGFDIVMDNSPSINDAFPGWDKTYEATQEPQVWAAPGPAWVLFGNDRGSIVPTNIFQLDNPVDFETNWYTWDNLTMQGIGWDDTIPFGTGRYGRCKARVKIQAGMAGKQHFMLVDHSNGEARFDIGDGVIDLIAGTTNNLTQDTTSDFVIIDMFASGSFNNGVNQAIFIVNGEHVFTTTAGSAVGSLYHRFGKDPQSGNQYSQLDSLRVVEYNKDADFGVINVPMLPLIEGAWNTISFTPKFPSFSIGSGANPSAVARLALVFHTKQTAAVFTGVILDNLRAIADKRYQAQPIMLVDWKIRKATMEDFEVGDVLVEGFESSADWTPDPGTAVSDNTTEFIEGTQSVNIDKSS